MYHMAVVVAAVLAAALSYKLVIVSSLLLGTGFLFASYILYLIVANRQAAFPTARAFLEERVQEGLAVRRNRSRQRNPTRSSKHSCFSQALWWSIYSLCCSGDSTGGMTWHLGGSCQSRADPSSRSFHGHKYVQADENRQGDWGQDIIISRRTIPMKYWWTQLGELSFIESTLQLEIIILTTTYSVLPFLVFDNRDL